MGNPYHADILPSPISEDARQSRDGCDLLSAETVARTSHEAIQQDYEDFYGFPRAQALGQAQRIGKIVRPLEEAALTEWAKETGKGFGPNELLPRWEEQGSRGGMENMVFHDPGSNRWVKINTLAYHTNHMEFLHRLAIHNYLFPDVPLRLEGYLLDWKECLPVISQPHVIHFGFPVNEEESGAELQKMGAHWNAIENAYIFEDLGVAITDFHEENVLRRQDGGLSFIDTDLRLTFDTKKNRLQSNRMNG